MHKKTSTAFLTVILALSGCDGSPPADPDAGPTDTDSGMTSTPDAGTDSGPAPAEGCDAARAVTLTDGEQTITGDTTGMGSDVALGELCGGEAAPQEILALTLPGTGEKSVTFDLAIDGTAADFDTVVEVRTGACESATDAVCFDDVSYPTETRSAGHLTAEGGSTVYLIVTGYAAENAGAWSMSVNVSDDPLPGPTFTGGDVLRVGTDHYDVLVDGGDVDGDAQGIRITFLDAAAAPIGVDFNDDGAPDLAEFDFTFDTSLDGETSFTDALVRIADPDVFAGTSAATQAQVAIFDRFGIVSAPMMLAIRDVTVAGRGEACGADAVCSQELECVAATCQIPAATMTACSAATALVVTEATPATTTGSLEPGAGHLNPTCVNASAPHAEDIYTVVVPAGAFDLIASTDADATGDADTAVFVQTTCGDSETEVACDDDSGEGVRSIATIEDVAAGTYTIAVEIVGPHDAATAYQLDVSLRPVIGEGVSCDPMEIMNRCSTGACPAGDAPVCPAAPPPAP